MGTNRIDISAKELYNHIYFICAKSQNKMYGLNGKSDFIGGIIDRWINTIGETLIFDNYLFPKYNLKFKVINDFYLYDPTKVNICPDLIGVKTEKNDIPFIKFIDKWHIIEGAPELEIKTFKLNQYLVSLRNQGYENKYLLLLNMQLDSNYLISFFKDNIFKKAIYEKLIMNDSIFNVDRTLNVVSHASPIIVKDKIGEIELLQLTTGKNFFDNSEIVNAGISPIFIKDIIEVNSVRKPLLNRPLSSFVYKSSNFYKFKNNGFRITKSKKQHLLMWTVSTIQNISIVKINKSNLYVYVKEESLINEIKLKSSSYYKIEFGTIERQNSKSNEYFLHKSLVHVLENHEEELMIKIEEFCK